MCPGGNSGNDPLLPGQRGICVIATGMQLRMCRRFAGLRERDAVSLVFVSDLRRGHIAARYRMRHALVRVAHDLFA